MPVPLIAWIAAVALAIVVLAFCGYEVAWKARRLRRDLDRLRQLATELHDVQRQTIDVQQRIGEIVATGTAG